MNHFIYSVGDVDRDLPGHGQARGTGGYILRLYTGPL
jgi:hypothetical protein